MAIPKSQKKARNKWDAANMTVLGCKVRTSKADLFKDACRRRNTTPNAVFIAAIDNFLSAEENENEN